MNLGDLGKKAQEFLGTEQGEQRSDDVLEKGEQILDEKTGGTHDAQIEKGRQFADDHIGDEQTRGTQG
jgi:antitoxin protein of toxin-antitoxin system